MFSKRCPTILYNAIRCPMSGLKTSFTSAPQIGMLLFKWRFIRTNRKENALEKCNTVYFKLWKCVCVCVCVYLSALVCVCLCVREREKRSKFMFLLFFIYLFIYLLFCKCANMSPVINLDKTFFAALHVMLCTESILSDWTQGWLKVCLRGWN